jgi:hypothetical protein
MLSLSQTVRVSRTLSDIFPVIVLNRSFNAFSATTTEFAQI